MSEEKTTQAERMAIARFARYTAYTAHRMSGKLLALTAKLEELNIIDPNRTSKQERDKKLRKMATDLDKYGGEINEMMKSIPRHPDAENLIRSLLGDLDTLHHPKDTPIDTIADTGGEKKELLDSDTTT